MIADARMLKVIKEIRERYSKMDHAEYAEKVAMGYLSDNFIIESRGNKAFLKQYRFDQEEKISSIHEVKQFFANGDIPIILPLKTKQGSTYFFCEGKYFALFPFVEGRTMKTSNRSQKAFALAGKMLAKIHAWSAQQQPKIPVQTVSGWNRKKFMHGRALVLEKLRSIRIPSEFDMLATEVMGYKSNIVKKISLRYEDIAFEEPILAHGDYHSGNIFYDTDDNIIAVFDLEKTEYSPRVSEVVRAMDFMCFSGKYEKENYENAKMFLKSYNEAFPLPEEELENGLRAYLTKQAFSLWIETEHYVKQNIRVDDLLAQEYTRLKYYGDNVEKLANELACAIEPVTTIDNPE